MEAEKNEAQRKVKRTSRPSSSMICLSLYPANVETNTISMANQSPPNRRQNAALAKLVSISTSHFPVGFVVIMHSKCSTAAGRPSRLSATSQLSWLKRVFKSKLMPHFAVLRCAISACTRSAFHTETVTWSGMMNMSRSTPKASAIRLAFFSMRMHVDPHPDNRDAYSARNAAVLRKAELSAGLFMLLDSAFILFVGNPWNLFVSGDVEHISFPTELKIMCCFVAATAATVFGTVIFDGSEDKCA